MLRKTKYYKNNPLETVQNMENKEVKKTKRTKLGGKQVGYRIGAKISVAQLARKHTEKVIAALLEVALCKDPKCYNAKVAACNSLLDRAYGRVMPGNHTPGELALANAAVQINIIGKDGKTKNVSVSQTDNRQTADIDDESDYDDL